MQLTANTHTQSRFSIHLKFFVHNFWVGKGKTCDLTKTTIPSQKFHCTWNALNCIIDLAKCALIDRRFIHFERMQIEFPRNRVFTCVSTETRDPPPFSFPRRDISDGKINSTLSKSVMLIGFRCDAIQLSISTPGFAHDYVSGRKSR